LSPQLNAARLAMAPSSRTTAVRAACGSTGHTGLWGAADRHPTSSLTPIRGQTIDQ